MNIFEDLLDLNEAQIGTIDLIKGHIQSYEIGLIPANQLLDLIKAESDNIAKIKSDILKKHSLDSKYVDGFQYARSKTAQM